MKRFVIILMALAVGLSVSAQRGRYSKGRKPVRTTQRATPRQATTIRTCPDSNHPHAIDLGLPSGTKWACCNVGASRPTAYGDYYAWGEIATKINYDWSTYKWGKADNQLTKYCNDPYYAKNRHADNKTTLDPEDDVAHVKWGGQWRMPTKEQMEELYNNTIDKWIENYKGTGVDGYLFTAINGKSIFLPAAGCRYGKSLIGAGFGGDYCSSSLYSSIPYDAYYLYFNSGYVGVYYILFNNDRCYGRTVRPVRP